MERTRHEHERLPRLGFKSAQKLRAKFGELCVALRTDIDPRVHWGNIRSKAQLEDEGESPRVVESRTLAQALAHAKQHELRGLVLLGDPGTGKTTFLRQALLAALEDPTALGLSERTIPVFLPLRELGGERDLGSFIQAQLPGRDPTFEDDFGKRLVRRGELFLLFDGLDEIAELEQREQVARWIESQLGNMRQSSHVLVSCRHAGYLVDIELNANFVELNLRHLDDEQMAQLVHNWYASVEDDGLIPTGEALARADALLEILQSPQFGGAQMYEMARNPLLLTGICWVHLRHGQLGRARVELYEQCIDALAKNWRRRCADEGKPFLLTREQQLETLLRPAAAAMHEQRNRRASFADLRGPVAIALEHHELKGVEVDAFLRGARDGAGLLSGIGEQQLEFIHLGFQEFLTAAQLVDTTNYQHLVEHFDDSWWREVVLLALGRPGAFGPFMDLLVGHECFARRASSDLMERCLMETAELSTAPFEKLLREGARFGWLRQWLERVFRRRRWSDLEQRQLAAARLMARKMPDALEGLDEVLAGHAQRSVRRWWKRHLLDAKLETREVQGVELVQIPKGRFLMGSPEGVGDDDERPRHEVELASFFLARTPVTNEQYGRYLDANPDVDKPRYWADSRYNQPSQPVVGVSWHDAQRYCGWAGLMLPTEAQWEYACRARTETRYWSGDDVDDLRRVGWYSGNSEGRLHPVAEKEPNPFGLYDVHGNVWEWCLDGWGASYTTSPQPVHGLRREPVGDGYRVVRGGGWRGDADSARSAYRYYHDPGNRYDYIGFRPAQGIP